MEHQELTNQLRAFVAERDWSKFHTSENLAKSISIEAAELLEIFQWGDQGNLDELKDELADVLTYCFLLADKHNLDVTEIVVEKLAKSRGKYPIETAKGKSTKYDRL